MLTASCSSFSSLLHSLLKFTVIVFLLLLSPIQIFHFWSNVSFIILLFVNLWVEFCFLEKKSFLQINHPALCCRLIQLFAAFKRRADVDCRSWCDVTGYQAFRSVLYSTHIHSQLTHIPRVITFSPTWIGLATKAAPIVCEEEKTSTARHQSLYTGQSQSEYCSFMLSYTNMELLLKSWTATDIAHKSNKCIPTHHAVYFGWSIKITGNKTHVRNCSKAELHSYLLHATVKLWGYHGVSFFIWTRETHVWTASMLICTILTKMLV